MPGEPKLHHYVPRFYLEHFCDARGKLWVWDKVSRRVYQASPNGVAAQTNFYRVPELVGTDEDPLFLEKSLAALEGDAADVLRRCIEQLKRASPLDRIEMAEDERWTLSSFLAVQALRTAEQREILALFATQHGGYSTHPSAEEQINLHARMLCGDLVRSISEHLFNAIWVYAKNETSTPFWTSDNPVALKTGDNSQWLKVPSILAPGTYTVFPITPQYIMYCKEPTHWAPVKRFESRLSPVRFDTAMVNHENSGQIFMATRHLIAPLGEFSWANEFVEMISKQTRNDGQAEP